MKTHKIYFWVHFVVVFITHLVMLILPWGFVEILLDPNLSEMHKFYQGCVFFSIAGFGLNHLINPKAYCFISSWEHQARRKAGLPPIHTSFMNRFYGVFLQAFRSLTGTVPKKAEEEIRENSLR